MSFSDENAVAKTFPPRARGGKSDLA